MEIFVVVIINLFALGLGMRVYLANRKKRMNQWFGIMSLSTIMWVNFAYLGDSTKNIADGAIWYRLNLGAVSLFLLSAYHFYVLCFLKQGGKNILLEWLVTLGNLLFFALAIFTNLIIETSQIQERGTDFVYGRLGDFYNYFALSVALLIFYYLGRYYFSLTRSEKLKIQYFLIGTFSMIIFNIIFNIIFPTLLHTIKYQHFGDYSSIFLLTFTAYAIIRYRLMNIKLVISRSILYLLLVSIVAALFTLATFLSGKYLQQEFGVGPFFTTLVASIIIVIGLDPLKSIIARATDKVFYKDKIDYQNVLRTVSQTINKEIDLDILVAAVTRILRDKLKIKRVILFLPNRRGGGYSGIDIQKSTHRAVRLNRKEPLIATFRNRKDPIVTEELSRQIYDMSDGATKTDLNRVLASLERLNAQVLVPIFLDDQLKGLLLFGDKLSGDVYAKDDLQLFEVVAPEIGTALEKAQLYKEVKDFNVKLRIEVKNATEELQTINLELQERNNFLIALQKITGIITRSLDLQKVTQTIVDGVNTELHYLGAALFLTSRDRRTISLNAISDATNVQELMGSVPAPKNFFTGAFSATVDNFLTRSIRTGHIQVSDRLSDFSGSIVKKDIVDNIQDHFKIRAAVAVPIFSEQEIIGTILYVLQRERRDLKETDIQMMRSLADQSGIVVRNLKLYEQLQDVNGQLQKANADLKQLDEVKSEFMSIASHQLRTPLSGIMGYLSMLVEGDYGKFTSEQDMILENVLDATKRMIRLVNVFLNITRIEAGRFKLNRTEVQFEEVIANVVHELMIPAKQKGLTLTFDPPTPKTRALWVDRDKFTDVVLNLVDNAIKYTEKGWVKVRLLEEKTGIRVEVSDSGVGIDPRQATNLFNKFVRGSGIARIQPDGSGLGLFIAKKIVEAHAGRVWVESAGEGKGSTFIFELAFVKNREGASEDPYETPEDLARKRRKAGGEVKVLEKGSGGVEKGGEKGVEEQKSGEEKGEGGKKL